LQTKPTIYRLTINYGDTVDHSIFEKNIKNQTELKLSAGYYTIKYNATIVIHGKGSINNKKDFNMLVVTPPNDKYLYIAAFSMAVPTAILGAVSGILYYKARYKN
jgi:hypothetical protein